eukprot:818400_1
MAHRSSFDELLQIARRAAIGIYHDDIVGNWVFEALERRFKNKQEVLDDLEHYDQCTIIRIVSSNAMGQYNWNEAKDPQILHQMLQAIFRDSVRNITTLLNEFTYNDNEHRVNTNHSLNWNGIEQIDDCKNEHVLYIADQFILYHLRRNKIIQCIRSNAFDGAQLKAMQKEAFALIICDYWRDMTLYEDNMRLHTAILTFDFAALHKPLQRLNQNDFCEWVVECAQNIAPPKTVQIIKNLIIKKGLNGKELTQHIKMVSPSNPSVFEDFMHNALVCDGVHFVKYFTSRM